ncbi:cobalt transport protein [Methanocorpusculum labreanum Z]|uniref:Cobalt transport protein n=1 Tax=Methanocorpusculum labreanum (strain ATCC 43576 / DSM 4855 / Z) TaxID=410358 RepID=A2SQ30_METLZ|nr:energy-coupling factor transporter transmembrane component T [Methanocorpusculum labreanum]ABN06436.1 cobalt transport protein [Methanocorpusculum labreanum Z]
MKISKKVIQYVDADTIFHRLDPGTKIILILFFSIIALLINTLPAIFLLMIFIYLPVIREHLVLPLIRSLRFLLPVFIFIFSINLFFPQVTSADPWAIYTFLTVTGSLSLEGIGFACLMTLRLFVIATVSTLFIMTTTSNAFVHRLKSVHIPETLAFSLGYAMKSITTLSSDLKNIMDAQRSRGIEFEKGNPADKGLHYMALGIPITISVMQRSKQTADAMQCRGFGRAGKKTLYQPCRMGKTDYLALMISIVVGLVLLYFSFAIFS